MADDSKSDAPSPAAGSSLDASRTGMRRRSDTLFGMLRRFGRLWGFLAFLLFVIVLFRGIALPFIFGLLVAYLLGPIVGLLQPRMGRVFAVITCYVVILGALAGFFAFLLPAVASDFAKLRHSAPEAIEKVNQEYLPRATAWANDRFGEFLAPEPSVEEPRPPSELIMTPTGKGSYKVNLDGARLQVEKQDDGTWIIGPQGADLVDDDPLDLDAAVRKFFADQGDELTESIGPAIQAIVTGVAGFLTSFVITFMIAAFVLVDLDRVNRFARSLIPHEYRTDFEELWAAMDKGLGGVVRGQILICLVNGALTFVGLVIFQVKYSFLLALMAGAFSLIPIFGTIISSIPIIVIALMSDDAGLSFGPALGMLAWISGIHLLEANVLNPKIIGDAAHIHPVIVIFALLAGEHMFGLVGALLAIPATSLVQAVYLHARRRSPVFSRDPEFDP